MGKKTKKVHQKELISLWYNEKLVVENKTDRRKWKNGLKTSIP